MAMWTWDGLNWRKVPWHREAHAGKAIIYGRAESLATAPKPRDRLRVVQNYYGPLIEPHLWCALDKPSDKIPALSQPCPKLLRGTYESDPVEWDGKTVEAREVPGTYFADLQSMDRTAVFDQRGYDAKFLWEKNTMVFAIHVVLWMGYRDIAFAGIDLKGDYVGGLPATAKQKRLFLEQAMWLKWFVEEGERRGVRVYNLTPDSTLAEFMPTEDLDDDDRE